MYFMTHRYDHDFLLCEGKKKVVNRSIGIILFQLKVMSYLYLSICLYIRMKKVEFRFVVEKRKEWL